MKIIHFQHDLTGESAKKEALVTASVFVRCSARWVTMKIIYFYYQKTICTRSKYPQSISFVFETRLPNYNPVSSSQSPPPFRSTGAIFKIMLNTFSGYLDPVNMFVSNYGCFKLQINDCHGLDLCSGNSFTGVPSSLVNLCFCSNRYVGYNIPGKQFFLYNKNK